MIKKITPIVLLILLLSYACEDNNDYLVDGGIITSNKVNMSTLEFFESHDQLDTLALLIKRAGLEDMVNQANNTVFAPNNLSINEYTKKVLQKIIEEDPEATYTVDDIPKDTLVKYLPGYIFPERITRDNLQEEQGALYTALNGEEHRISLKASNDYRDQLDDRPLYLNFVYKVGDTWDTWNDIVDDNEVVIRTSNLESTNGMIHVLQSTHILFNYK